MGTCTSNAGRQPGPGQSGPSGVRERQTSPRRPSIGDLSENLVASAEARTPWGAAPRVILANESKYNVSYWVFQEDKKKAIAHRKHIASSMGAGVDVGNTGGKVSANVNRDKEETVEMEEVEHVLMRDHRMLPNGKTQATHVPFPAKCREVRVFGYFQRDDGEWRYYKEKVYSIGRFNNTFTLNALNANIAPYDAIVAPQHNRDERPARVH